MRLWGEGTLKRGWVACALAGLTVLAAACGRGDSNTSTDVTTPQATAASGSVGSTPAAAPAAGTAGQNRTFVDATGKSFTVEKPPRRVVALSPSVVELMYAVGAPPVARPSSANFPEQARSVPAIGTSYQPNLEQIVAQTPDFIIADAQLQGPQTVAELAKLAPVFSVRVQSFADVTGSLRTLGTLLGRPEDGEKAARELEAKLQAVQAKLPPESERPKVFIMVGDPNAFFAAKPSSFAGDVLAQLGAKNLVQGGPDPAGAPPGFTNYSLEQLVALDPDVILVASIGRPGAPPTSQQLASNPAWSGLRAVKNGRVQEISTDAMVQSAGPRVGQVIDSLAPVLYPGRF